MSEAAAPAVCAWPGDKRWVYSITFDEALSDLHRFAIPILQDYGVPGHVEVVVGQIGQVRYLGAMSITDALNRPDVPADADPLWLNRTFLHHQGYGPFFSEFDPFRNIQ